MTASLDTNESDGPISRTAPHRRLGTGLFRAFWRWHFYASVLVIPVMAVLAVTGIIWLWRFEIDPAMHPELMRVPDSTATASYEAQQRAVVEAFPDAVTTGMTEPWADRPTAFTVTLPDGRTEVVYVNPHDATVLGSIDPTSLLSEKAIQLHGELMAGSRGDAVIELAACWALVMALTGYYLYFAGARARRRRRAADARGASLRSRHALVGAIAGVGILFLVVSGLPWTGIWGSKAQELATGQGTSLWADDPGAESVLADRLADSVGTEAPAPWALGQSEVPESDPHAGHGTAHAGPSAPSISIDQAMAQAQAQGLARPFTVAYPEGETGVYSVMADSWMVAGNPAFSDVSREAVVHVDQYSGLVAAEYGYADYPLAAKVVLQSIALHEGRRFATPNKLASTVFCLGVLFLCVTGPLMWWKRRPRRGGLAAPRGRMPIRATPWLAAALVALGIVLPLFGLSLLVVLLLDHLVIRRVPRLAGALGTVD